MSNADLLRRSFRSLEVSDDFSEAVVAFDDDSRLHFCHRVDRRSAKATGAGDTNRAAQALSTIVRFRLNGKHLDVQFTDGSRWETLFAASGG